jgi:hypothetical protein
MLAHSPVLCHQENIIIVAITLVLIREVILDIVDAVQEKKWYKVYMIVMLTGGDIIVRCVHKHHTGQMVCLAVLVRVAQQQ